MTQPTKTTKRLTSFGILAAFVVPVLLAKVALENDWFNRASTNHGELIQPVMDFSAALSTQPPKWRLVYHLPASCDSACENALYSIHQVWQALGRESDRAQATVVVNPASNPAIVARLRADAQVRLVAATEQPTDTRLTHFGQNTVYLVDTLNNAMLRYTISEDRQTAIMDSRDMLADVKKLLKLSRIG